jgi:hypothetical protein
MVDGQFPTQIPRILSSSPGYDEGTRTGPKDRGSPQPTHPLRGFTPRINEPANVAPGVRVLMSEEALSIADFLDQCLPGWSQRLLVCRAARRFPSRRTGTVSRPDRIGTPPEGDVSRSRSLPPPGGPFSRDVPIEPRGELPLLRPSGRECAHRASGRELTPPPTQPAPRQFAPGVDSCRHLERSLCLPQLAQRRALARGQSLGPKPSPGQRFWLGTCFPAPFRR